MSPPRMGVFRNGVWLLDQDGSNDTSPDEVPFNFGGPGDLPVVGQFNTTTPADEIGVFTSGIWRIDFNGNRSWDGPEGGDLELSFGRPGDVPVVAQYGWLPVCTP